MVDVKTCLDNAQEKMDMAIMYLEEALAHIRAGKASARLSTLTSVSCPKTMEK